MDTATREVLTTLRPDERLRPVATSHTVAPPVARIALTVTVLALVVGLVLRLWYLFHVPTNSDEAIVGFMANDALHGHFFAFYWGQAYGGGEPYVVAALFSAFGHSAFVLGLTGIVLSAVASLLTWRAACRLVSSPALAALTGALVWVMPDAAIANSTREYGFRGVTMACGLACLFLSLRLLDGSHSWADIGALGLFAGIGWWSSPEIGYFLLPSALITVGAIAKSALPWRRWMLRLAGAAAIFCLGALPWLWANVNSGFASLKPSSFPNGAITPLNTGFGGRLSIFVRLSLPIELNLRRLGSGAFLFGGAGTGTRHALGLCITVAVIAVVVVAVLLCVARGGRWLAIGITVLAFPLLFAAQPGTWFWPDGRYVVFLGPLLALAVVAGLEVASRHVTRGRAPSDLATASLATLAMTAILAIGIVASVFATAADNATTVPALVSGWGNPNAPVDRAVAALKAAGIRDGFADYWVAYKIDLLSGDTMTITPARGDVDRQKSFDRTVDAAPRQAWIFVPATQTSAGYEQFSTTPVIAGPDGISEAQFVAALQALNVPYRTVDAGIVSAVIPDRKVTVRQVEAAGA